MYMTYYRNEKENETARARREESRFQAALARESTARETLAELSGMRSLYGMHTRKAQKRA